ncbi:MAG: DNA repair protein RecN [Gammaproteobacteria bacterium]|nr:DNA repair protein RecN [Gammaproteobacteria bacterium]
MLTHLHIRNYALVDELELELEPGFTVLTGETGAGKSILIEALGLALGDRADAGVIRIGTERAEVTATLAVTNNEAARAWLLEQELETGDGAECIVRRTVAADGRSKAWINGSTVPIQTLRELGALLVDVHGQHEHHSLLKRDHQLTLLDGFASQPALLSAVELEYRAWRQLTRELEELNVSGSDGDAQIEFLRFQLDELDELDVTPQELEQLDAEHKRLANAGLLIETCQAGLAGIDEDEDSLCTRLTRVLNDLRQQRVTDARLQPVIDLLDGAAIQIEEAATELRTYVDRLELDPQRLEEVERRLAAIHTAARKHRLPARELPELRQRLGAQIERLAGAWQRREEIAREIAACETRYRGAAAKLGAARAKAARTLEKKVMQEMRRLGMPDGVFTIELQARADDMPSPSGLDRIEFLVSTNPHQPPRPLTKVASGGEMSRIGLAIQVVTADQVDVPTVIFDEVDVGIGGRVAEIVGQGLRRLGECRQVLCITHLAQVAALGHHHLQVSKRNAGKQTLSTIQPLAAEERREEIARMLGGVEISAQTRAHAEEMIKRSEEFA